MISFTRIAKAVLAEGQYDPVNEESDIKRLNRKFNRFVEALGISATSLKDSRSRMYFSEEAHDFFVRLFTQSAKRIQESAHS